MAPRPLSDRVAGIDDVLVAAGGDVEHLNLLRFAMADFVRRHGEVLDALETGVQGVLLVCDGLVAYWNDVEVVDGLPRHGGELGPVAAAVLDAAGSDRDAVIEAGCRTRARLGEIDDDAELAVAVCAELLDALVIAALDNRVL